MKKLSVLLVVLGLFFACNRSASDGPYFATGIKIGEVDQNSAIVWARLTEDSSRVEAGAPMPIIDYTDPESGEPVEIKKGRRPDLVPHVSFPEGIGVADIEGAVAGSEGLVRLQYKKQDEATWHKTRWVFVDPDKSYTHQFQLEELAEGTNYQILAEARSLNRRRVSASIAGSFVTAPNVEEEKDVNFIVITGTSYSDVDSDDGYKFYKSAMKLDPDFFVHTGDIVYYDYQGKSLALAEWHWDRMYSLPNHIAFHSQVPSYFMKDDHDTWMDDAYPGMETHFMGDFTYEQGTEIFLYEVPMGEKTYRTVRWGKDLQVWFVEGRDFRSPNTMDDGADKTIWGEEQIDWFKETVLASDATFKVLVTPTPIVGPDRAKGKNDNHANLAFKHEGDMLRDFISAQKNMYSVCGDRHWQYMSHDLRTGLIEASSGPGSHAHAGGWPKDVLKEEHMYLNVCGGFLEVEVSRETGLPVLTFRHHDPDGLVLNEYVVGEE